MDSLINHIESLIFCSPKPITIEEIQNCLKETYQVQLLPKDIELEIEALTDRFKSEHSSIEVVKSGGGYQFLTKIAYHACVGTLLKQQSKKRLSKSSLETLSIIAYKQPITKNETERIRGVNCDYAFQKLLEKELINIQGKSDKIRRASLYGTSNKFLDYFGINALNELPTPKDFELDENTIGTSTN